MARVALKTAFPEYIIDRLFTSTQFQRPAFQTIKAESLQKVCISADSWHGRKLVCHHTQHHKMSSSFAELVYVLWIQHLLDTVHVYWHTHVSPERVHILCTWYQKYILYVFLMICMYLLFQHHLLPWFVHDTISRWGITVYSMVTRAYLCLDHDNHKPHISLR